MPRFCEYSQPVIANPESITSQQTVTEIEKNLVTVPEEQEDLQAMAFYAWIKSKALRRNYYEVLLEVVEPSLGSEIESLPT